MTIERLSIKSVTISIFLMLGLAAVILSLLAGSYFNQAALEAQITSLSRVIEVATQEVLNDVRNDTFHLGTHLSQEPELIDALRQISGSGSSKQLAKPLDDPFINGFPGFTKISLEKIRVFDKNLDFVSESTKGLANLEKKLADELGDRLSRRQGIDRLKALDVLWLSNDGPLFSTIVPIGGLNIQGYLEVVINPEMNLPDIGQITKTPISVYSASGEPIYIDNPENPGTHLPVSYTLTTSDARPAFRIVGYENVSALIKAMENTRIITVSGFLLLTLAVLLFALWLFRRFLFIPLEQMIKGMERMAADSSDFSIHNKGLREFHTLAQTFETMSKQVKARTNELRISQARLIRLLDLHESAVLYINQDDEIVYFNQRTCALFGYQKEALRELYLSDLFSEDIDRPVRESARTDSLIHKEFHKRLHCICRDGTSQPCDAVINTLSIKGETGYAIALAVIGDEADSKPGDTMSIDVSSQRMNAVEQSLNSLLEIARNNPALLNREESVSSQNQRGNGNKDLRTLAVAAMRAALSCWEQDLGKSKIELAEESGIWQVYIDKSTPMTRTLDKYLRIEKCPKNPRCRRIIDTAEFVITQMGGLTTPLRDDLEEALRSLHLHISG